MIERSDGSQPQAVADVILEAVAATG